MKRTPVKGKVNGIEYIPLEIENGSIAVLLKISEADEKIMDGFKGRWAYPTGRAQEGGWFFSKLWGFLTVMDEVCIAPAAPECEDGKPALFNPAIEQEAVGNELDAALSHLFNGFKDARVEAEEKLHLGWLCSGIHAALGTLEFLFPSHFEEVGLWDREVGATSAANKERILREHGCLHTSYRMGLDLRLAGMGASCN